jgi:hypothetical protein
VSGPFDSRDWTVVRIGLAVVALVVVADLVVWAVHDHRHPGLTRLEATIACLRDEKHVAVQVPAGDPLSATAGAGSLRTTVEGNGVIVALASSGAQAQRLGAAYDAVGGDLTGRLEVRGETVYLWDRVASPTQRQTLYDCQY